jgi:NAD+ synthase (glutamine-hydrolysing)
MGATVILNPSASNETISKEEYRKLMVRASSAKLICGYIYASAGEGESTQDLVFGGHNLIGENGIILAEAECFSGGAIYTDLDISKICTDRRRMGTFGKERDFSYVAVPFKLEMEETNLERAFGPMPFVPADEKEKSKRCEKALSIQSYGLKKRYEHTGMKTAVVGISGGLDSTLALIITVRTFDMLRFHRKNVIAVTMPCFGTTDRTYDNACKLADALGVTLKEISIAEATSIHFRDIGQDPQVHDVVYENAQARERTQVLMDIANREAGVVIGTGDMSELALGWATYNGDHMSMYGVNAGIPKTLVRHLIKYYRDSCADQKLGEVLSDILDTPVSPELLPPVDGKIAQKTEDLIGPYDLHDFFLYYMFRMGYPPSKIYRVAKEAFRGLHEDDVILKWMKVFYGRFFSQQFKRSCMPDGPKVGSVALSPRGDLRMPSDACVTLWLEEIEGLDSPVGQ